MDRVVKLSKCRFFDAFGRRLAKNQIRSHPIAIIVGHNEWMTICEVCRLEGNKLILYTSDNREMECEIVSVADEPLITDSMKIRKFAFCLVDYRGEKIYDFPTLIYLKESGKNGNVTMCGYVNSHYKEFKVPISDINDLGFKFGNDFFKIERVETN